MKKSYIAALLIIGILMGYIISTSANYSTYESFATAQSNNGKQFQVVGKLAKDRPMEYNPQKDPNRFSFYMVDSQGETRQVIYAGTKPQDFEKSEQIVLTGKMNGEVFEASKVLLKCPSKYIAKDVDKNGYYDMSKAGTNAPDSTTTTP